MTRQTHLLAGTPASMESTSTRKQRSKLFLLLLSSFLLLAAIIGIVSGITANSHKNDSNENTPSHSVLRTSCSSTLYPDLCYSSIAAIPSLVSSITVHKDVIHTSINLTKTAVEHSFFRVEKLAVQPNRTEREKTALHDCLEMFDETLEELRKAEDDLQGYPGGGKTLIQHAGDLKTLLSATMTNQESCIDGFSHDDVCRHLRQSCIDGVTHVSKMCSNSLAMIKNMTDGDIAVEAARLSATTGSGNRKLLEEGETVYNMEEQSGFPEWMSAGDRKLLQASTVTPNVVVAADGSGNFMTVSAAVAAAPDKSAKRYVIRIKAGVYKENVDVSKKKTNIMFVGDGAGNTIITGSRNVVDGSTTFHSATVAVVGERFLARDITFQNTAGASKHQAVALRVGSDLSAFYRCNILAYQDTLYVHSLRQFYRECLIQGTVDFIFGNAAVVFQNCNLQARRPDPGQKNMFTAQGREDPNQNTGISIQGCTISADSDLAPVQKSFPTYLGRPWKTYSRTVVMKSTITDVIDPAGWHEWSGNFALNTLFYAEYLNAGAGAGTANRVKWKGYKVITSASEAQQFTPGNFIGGSGWLESTE